MKVKLLIRNDSYASFKSEGIDCVDDSEENYDIEESDDSEDSDFSDDSAGSYDSDDIIYRDDSDDIESSDDNEGREDICNLFTYEAAPCVMYSETKLIKLKLASVPTQGGTL